MLCRCNTYLRNSFAQHVWSVQFIRYVLRCLSFAYQFYTLHLLAFAMHRLSTPLLYTSLLFNCMLCRCKSILICSELLHRKSIPCNSIAYLFNPLHFLYHAARNHALPLPVTSSRFFAFAVQITAGSCHSS